MSKQEIDNYFTSIIPMLTKTAKGIIYKQNKGYLEADLVVNESYIHLMKNKDLINEYKDIEKIATQFIKMNIIWENSQINKLEKLNNNYQATTEEDEDDFSQDRPRVKTIETEDNFDIELEQKIEIERWYNEKKCLLEIYRNQLTDKKKQIIYDCYFKKGITKGVALAKHLGINKDYSCKYIREMKEDIRLFAINYNNNNQ